MRSGWLAVASAMALAMGTAAAGEGVAKPDRWPAIAAPAPDAAVEKRINRAARRHVARTEGRADHPGRYRRHRPRRCRAISSRLDPERRQLVARRRRIRPASAWVAAADAYYDASMRPNGTSPRIPVMWGSDAVHGHNNIVGATLFPHNIGLGAARESRPDGKDRTSHRDRDARDGPRLDLRADDRRRARRPLGAHLRKLRRGPGDRRQAMPRAFVHGLQGRRGDADWLRGPHIIATAKHFLADGGTAKRPRPRRRTDRRRRTDPPPRPRLSRRSGKPTCRA